MSDRACEARVRRRAIRMFLCVLVAPVHITRRPKLSPTQSRFESFRKRIRHFFLEAWRTRTTERKGDCGFISMDDDSFPNSSPKASAGTDDLWVLPSKAHAFFPSGRGRGRGRTKLNNGFGLGWWTPPSRTLPATPPSCKKAVTRGAAAFTSSSPAAFYASTEWPSVQSLAICPVEDSVAALDPRFLALGSSSTTATSTATAATASAAVTLSKIPLPSASRRLITQAMRNRFLVSNEGLRPREGLWTARDTGSNYGHEAWEQLSKRNGPLREAAWADPGGRRLTISMEGLHLREPAIHAALGQARPPLCALCGSNTTRTTRVGDDHARLGGTLVVDAWARHARTLHVRCAACTQRSREDLTRGFTAPTSTASSSAEVIPPLPSSMRAKAPWIE